MAFASNSRENETFATLTAPVSTAAGTSLQYLVTVPVPANTFCRAGQALRLKVWGTTAANTNTKTVALYAGTSTSSKTALTPSASAGANAAPWYLEATIQYQSSASESALGTGNFNGSGLAPLTQTLTLAQGTAFNLYVTATDGTSSAGDVTVQGLTCEGLSD